MSPKYICAKQNLVMMDGLLTVKTEAASLPHNVTQADVFDYF